MKTYRCWTTVDGRDLWITVQAQDSLQARSICEGLYRRCFSVEQI